MEKTDLEIVVRQDELIEHLLGIEDIIYAGIEHKEPGIHLIRIKLLGSDSNLFDQEISTELLLDGILPSVAEKIYGNVKAQLKALEQDESG